MFTLDQPNGSVEITISQILSLRPVTNPDSTCQTTEIAFRPASNRKRQYGFIALSVEDIVDKIRKAVGNDEAYGDYCSSELSYSHRIYLGRKSDGSTHKILCPLCGNISQIYHTFRCHCSINKPFSGNITENANSGLSISKQRFEIFYDDVEKYPHLSGLSSLRKDYWGNLYSNRKVSNISIESIDIEVANGKTEEAFTLNGKVKFSDQEIKVQTDVLTNHPHIKSLADLKENPQHLLWYPAD